MSELDTLLDVVLDDIEDLPEFKPFAPGAAQVLATMSTDTLGGKPAVKLDFKIVESLEVSDPQDAPPAPGDSCGTAFFLDNKYGLGNLKKWAAVFAAGLDLEGAKLTEIVEAVTDIECVLISKLRADKNDPDKKYLEIKELAIT